MSKIKIMDLNTIYQHSQKGIMECLSEFDIKRNKSSVVMQKGNCIYIFDRSNFPNKERTTFSNALYCYLVDEEQETHNCSYDPVDDLFRMWSDESSADYIKVSDILDNIMNEREFEILCADVYGNRKRKSAKIIDGTLVIQNSIK